MSRRTRDPALERAWRILSAWARLALDGSGDYLICDWPPEVGPVRVLARARTERAAWLAAVKVVAP